MKTILTTLILTGLALVTMPVAQAIPPPVGCEFGLGQDHCWVDTPVCDADYYRHHWTRPHEEYTASCSLPTGDDCSAYANSNGERNFGCTN